MGQALATGRISLRTVPRNFPGRSGTIEDQVYLCSPETAAASAMTGVITDPRTLEMEYPVFEEPAKIRINATMLLPPLEPEQSQTAKLVKGPNIAPLPEADPLPDAMRLPILLKLGDDISTDEIMPAGARALPFRSNIPEISRYVFTDVDDSYYQRALECRDGGSALVGGENYGQGSSREHAALAPRYLGLRVVIAKSVARIHWQNLANFGILPLTFMHPSDYDKVTVGDEIYLEDLHRLLSSETSNKLEVRVGNGLSKVTLEHNLSARQRAAAIAGGLVKVMSKRESERRTA